MKPFPAQRRKLSPETDARMAQPIREVKLNRVDRKETAHTSMGPSSYLRTAISDKKRVALLPVSGLSNVLCMPVRENESSPFTEADAAKDQAAKRLQIQAQDHVGPIARIQRPKCSSAERPRRAVPGPDQN